MLRAPPTALDHTPLFPPFASGGFMFSCLNSSKVTRVCKSLAFSCTVILMILLACGELSAQSTGTVAGSVSDATGAAVPNASIAIT